MPSWLIGVTFNDIPSVGFEVARKAARDAGHAVQERGGSMSEWIQQPDFWGGCEVQVEFGPPAAYPGPDYEVIITQKRSSAVSNWVTTSITKVMRDEKAK